MNNRSLKRGIARKNKSNATWWWRSEALKKAHKHHMKHMAQLKRERAVASINYQPVPALGFMSVA